MSFRPAIRVATLADLGEIQRIWAEGLAQAIPGQGIELPAEGASHLEWMVREQVHPFGVWVATDAQGQVIGWQSLMPCRNNPILRPRMAESSTYVRRQSGVANLGRVLLAHALAHAEATELQYVLGYVGVENVAALKMVAACDFTLLGTLPVPEKPPKTGAVHLFCRTLGGHCG